MLRKVEITDPGDSRLLRGEQVDAIRLRKVNEKLVELGKQTADL